MTSLFDKLAAEEEKFFSSQFLAPVLRGRLIRVRIAGIVYSMFVQPTREGWGIFTPVSLKQVRFVRQPTLSERQAYLRLFPVVRLILCSKDGNNWFGVPANQSSGRFKIVGLAPVRFAEEVQLFESVRTRFDGENCWFDGPDEKHDPRIPGYLRESLAALVDPEKLVFSGMTAEDREAYFVAYGPALAADIESKKDKQEERIKQVLARTKAQYRGYVERGNTFTVEFLVKDRNGDWQPHRPVVNKNTLRVESAGVCLSGNDSRFDLQSLADVLSEGYRTGNLADGAVQHGGYDEDW